MSTLRLRSLATLFVEQHLTENINLNIAIEEFANKKARKVTVYKIAVFISEIKMVLIFTLFFTIFPDMSFLFFV